MRIQVTVALLIVIALLSVVVYMESAPSGRVVEEAREFDASNLVQEEIIDMTPDVVDENQGTIVIGTNADFSAKDDGIVEFFASRKIRGLSIRYRLSDKRLTAGLPPLVSSEEVHFDGQKHMIAYVYKKNEGQSLYFDKKLVAQGEYTGVEEELPIGMVVSYPPVKVEPESVDVYADAWAAADIEAFGS